MLSTPLLALTPSLSAEGKQPSLRPSEGELAKAAFSSLFAVFDEAESTAPAEGSEGENPAEPTLLHSAALMPQPGMNLPELEQGGRILPPGEEESGRENDAAPAPPAERPEPAIPLTLTILAPAPASQLETDPAEHEAMASVRYSDVRPSPPRVAELASQERAPVAPAPPATAPAEKPTRAEGVSAITVKVAAADGAPVRPDELPGSRAADPLRQFAQQRAAGEVAHASPSPEPASQTQPPSAPAASGSPVIGSGHASPAPANPVAARDLSGIIDRLSAAREMSAPATATVSLDHRDFGELSLRFDQRQDGRLSVQIQPGTPEAQRELAAAMAADRSFASASEAAAAQQQPQGQAQSHSQASRGGLTGKDGGATGGEARHEQPHQRQTPARQPESRPAAKGREGIFA